MLLIWTEVLALRIGCCCCGCELLVVRFWRTTPNVCHPVKSDHHSSQHQHCAFLSIVVNVLAPHRTKHQRHLYVYRHPRHAVRGKPLFFYHFARFPLLTWTNPSVHNTLCESYSSFLVLSAAFSTIAYVHFGWGDVGGSEQKRDVHRTTHSVSRTPSHVYA